MRYKRYQSLFCLKWAGLAERIAIPCKRNIKKRLPKNKLESRS